MKEEIVSICVFAFPIIIAVILTLAGVVKNKLLWILAILLSLLSLYVNYLKFENDTKAIDAANMDKKIANNSLSDFMNRTDKSLNDIGLKLDPKSGQAFVTDSTKLAGKLKEKPPVLQPTPSDESDMSDGECRIYYNGVIDNIESRCMFYNQMGEPVIMYTGRTTSGASFRTRGKINIETNGHTSADKLVAGISKNGGSIQPPSVVYRFYFMTSDTSKPKRYGTINVTIRGCKQKNVVLNKNQLMLSVTGERDLSALKEQGLN